ncbi:chorismate mutase [Agromyces aerolatus]|uniref:chorismate mutase n=1 Tax=Agromyces sp. LY-1074 TaxID=3074080 RepID=UPI00285AB506|nr:MULTISPECIES: chorismate mutase [unclassified Agromyces]MDR5699850.1 chorismate mutase [Agromyces sp. LY-1074]MDR5706338.1 chorismate mutase [Agromyces sp. LY-1358]
MQRTPALERRRRTLLAVLAGCLCIAALSSCASPPDGASAPTTAPSPLETLVNLAAERLGSAEDAAASKWGTETRIDDPAREQQVLDNVRVLAGQHELSPELAEQIFFDQIQATESIQYTRFSEWVLDPTAAPVERPDLTGVRSTIDRLTEAMVLELSANQPVLLSDGCGDARDRAVRSVARSHQLDALYERALERATKSYCVDAATP